MGKSSKLSATRTQVSGDYLALVKQFPLRVIGTEAEHDRAIRIYTGLVGRKSPKLSAGERDYATVLVHFIRDFDRREFPLLATKVTPPERLQYVLKESGTTPGELATLLEASQPLISQILNGKRNLTVGHVRILADHFKVEAGYFL